MLTDNEIERAFHEMPHGVMGFLKDWGYLQFARAIEAAVRAEMQAQSEPVAWRTFDGEGGYDYRSYDDNEDYQAEYMKRNGNNYATWVEPLYLHPAPVQQELTCKKDLQVPTVKENLTTRIAELEASLDNYITLANTAYEIAEERTKRIAELEAEVAALKPWATTPAATLGAEAGKRITELEAQNTKLLSRLKEKLPGGKLTDKWESARVADYNEGWNDYRKAAIAAIAAAGEKI